MQLTLYDTFQDLFQLWLLIIVPMVCMWSMMIVTVCGPTTGQLSTFEGAFYQLMLSVVAVNFIPLRAMQKDVRGGGKRKESLSCEGGQR